MRLTRWLLAVATVAVLAIGGAACDQRVREADAKTPADERTPAGPAPVEPAALPPAEPAPAVGEPVPASPSPETRPVEPQPVEPQPVLSFLMIDGLGVHFPATRLSLHERDGKIRAELFSDLPKSALAHYEGNELYVEMDLDGAAGPQRVDGASWRYQSPSSEKADSANGIFLNGQRQHLQPTDVLIRFERQGEQLMAQVVGQFRAYQAGTPDALAPSVGVRGAIPVEVVGAR